MEKSSLHWHHLMLEAVGAGAIFTGFLWLLLLEAPLRDVWRPRDKCDAVFLAFILPKLVVLDGV